MRRMLCAGLIWRMELRRQSAVEPVVGASEPDLVEFLDHGYPLLVFAAVDSANLTRGGPLMRLEAARQGQVEFSSPAAQQTHLKAGVYYLTRRDGGFVRYVYGEAGVRPSPRWQMSMSPTVVREVDSRQYVTTLDGGTAATFGGRYIFARVDRSTFSAQFLLNYTFKPDLNVDVYAEPFAASGAYGPTGELIAAQTNQLRPFDVPGTRDFNARSFRSNVVLRNGNPAACYSWSGSRIAPRQSLSGRALRLATC
jgi:hypothetical protein